MSASIRAELRCLTSELKQAIMDALDTEYIRFPDICALVDGVPQYVTPVVKKTSDPMIADETSYYDAMANIITGTVEPSTDDCDCQNCVSCEVLACILMDGFDNDRGLATAGDTTTYEILVDGAVVNTVITDYLATGNNDGVNVSSWYNEVMAALNAVPGWQFDLEVDVPVTQQGKPTWRVTSDVTTAQTLMIRKNSGGSIDEITLSADGSGNIVGSTNWTDSQPFAGCDGAPLAELNAFDTAAVDKSQNTKYNLDDAAAGGTGNAYADVGNDNWTAAQLAASLNANAASAVPPVTGADYSTTVWDSVGDLVYVVSGPIPTSLDLVSIPVSLPVSQVV